MSHLLTIAVGIVVIVLFCTHRITSAAAVGLAYTAVQTGMYIGGLAIIDSLRHSSVPYDHDKIASLTTEGTGLVLFWGGLSLVLVVAIIMMDDGKKE